MTTIPYAAHRIPDLVKRNFSPDGLDQLWAGDITYISTWEAFLYLAVVENLASRRILGMSMASHMRASLVGDLPVNSFIQPAGLPTDTSIIEVLQRPVESGQYTSGEYGDLCGTHRVTQSVGRTGVCWDNAPSESFFATLRKDLVNRTTFTTRAEARIAIRHRIESWYNRRRLSSVIGYQTPIEWENHYRHNTQILAA